MEQVRLTREVNAIRIPAGDTVALPEGTEVYITQSLGGSWTVQAPSFGGLFRIAGRDAEALGMEIPEEAKVPEVDGASLEEQVEAALRTCYDPEIAVNIVDLGLIYDTAISEHEGGEGSQVDVKMTLTAVGCGMGPSIAADAEGKIRDLPGVVSATVEVVWDPPWNPQMISDAGREKLGIG